MIGLLLLIILVESSMIRRLHNENKALGRLIGGDYSADSKLC